MTYVNQFGRKGGRGIRPWLLIPKILGVMVYVGGLATVLGLWIASDFRSLELTDPRRQLVLDQVSRLMVFLVVPALIVALLMGFALLMQFPKMFIRTRWWQVKFLALALVIPAAHFYCRAKFTGMRSAIDKTTSDALAADFTWGMTAALIGSAGVVILSRLKPRLGQSPVNAVVTEVTPSVIPSNER